MTFPRVNKIQPLSLKSIKPIKVQNTNFLNLKKLAPIKLTPIIRAESVPEPSPARHRVDSISRSDSGFNSLKNAPIDQKIPRLRLDSISRSESGFSSFSSCSETPNFVPSDAESDITITPETSVPEINNNFPNFYPPKLKMEPADYQQATPEYIKYVLHDKYTCNLLKFSLQTTGQKIFQPDHFLCRLCYQTFNTDSEISNHLYHHFQPFRCHHCNFASMRAANLRRHYLTQSHIRTLKNLNLEDKIQEELKTCPRECWRCEPCNYTTYQKANLFRHLKTKLHLDIVTGNKEGANIRRNGMFDSVLKNTDTEIKVNILRIDKRVRNLSNTTLPEKTKLPKSPPKAKLSKAYKRKLPPSPKAPKIEPPKKKEKPAKPDKLFSTKLPDSPKSSNSADLTKLPISRKNTPDRSHKKLYKCKNCEYSTTYFNNLQRHISKKHENIEILSRMEYFVERPNAKKAQPKEEIFEKLPETVISMEKLEISCSQSESEPEPEVEPPAEEEELVDCGDGVYLTLEEIKNMSFYDADARLDQRYRCRICLEGFPEDSYLPRHISSHSKTFYCELCDFSCPYQSSFDEHLKSKQHRKNRKKRKVKISIHDFSEADKNTILAAYYPPKVQISESPSSSESENSTVKRKISHNTRSKKKFFNRCCLKEDWQKCTGKKYKF